MKKIFLLISYIIFFSTTKSQINKYGIPFITNYSSAIYSAEAQNWGITSDKRGIMYFANNNCVLEYDGNKWTQIFLPDNITVRSLACDNNGIVYVGAANNFGCLLPDSTGLLKYHSLKNKLDTAFHNFEEIWKIYIIDSNIYFSGKHFLLKYDYDTVIPTYTYQEQGNLFYFINQKNIFLSNYLNGLIYFDYESERIKQNYSIFKNKYITGIIKTSPNTFLIITYLNGIFELNITTGEVSVKNIPPETQEVLKQALILQATKLKNEDIVFSTNQSGIIITDKKYNIKNIISDKEQLQDATCYFSYEPGKETPLWTALNSGISKIEISSPYRFLDKSFGFEGSIWAINQKDSILYIGTNLGLFYLDYQDNEPVLKKIKFSNFSTIEVWTLLNFRGRMLIGTNFGLFEVIDNKAELVTITNQSNNFSIKTLFADPEDSSKLIIGRENGINILKIKNNFFVLDTLINLPQKEIRSISKDNNGNIWLGTHFNGLIKIDKNYNIKFYDKSKGLPTLKEPMVNTFRGKLFFATPMGLYTYDKSTDSIIPFTDFGVEFSNTHTYKTFVKGNSIWLNTARNNTEFIKQINFFNDSLQIDSSKFKRVKFKNIQSIFVDKNNILWIGTDKILYSFDLNKNFNNSQPFTTLIREVLLNKDSTLFNGTFFRKKGNKIIISTHQTPQFVKEIKYKYNTITFVWSSTFYEN